MMNRFGKKIFKIIVIFGFVVFLFVVLINLIVISNSSNYIDKEVDYDDYEYVIVLGAKVTNGEPSLMLKDRLDRAIEIYNVNSDIKIIISGDSSNPGKYDEISGMYNYLVINNVSSDNIIKDEYGICTYDSIVRMKNIIEENNVIIITQKYHLFRSVYIALELDIDAVGISARDYNYFGQLWRDIREILARIKDYCLVKIGANSKY